MTLDPATFAWACAALCAACAAPGTYAPAVWFDLGDAYWHAPNVRGRRECRCDATVLSLAWADEHETAAVGAAPEAQIGLGL